MKSLFIFTLVISLGLGSCTPMTSTRGNIIEPERLSAITPGQDTRSDIFKILGSPTTVSPFNENVWYYISQKTEKYGIFDPEITAERIVKVEFDAQGVVKDFQEMENARLNVPVTNKTTPTYGNEQTAIQQLFGNLGRFNPQPKK